jgi:hypothetical protein
MVRVLFPRSHVGTPDGELYPTSDLTRCVGFNAFNTCICNRVPIDGVDVGEGRPRVPFWHTLAYIMLTLFSSSQAIKGTPFKVISGTDNEHSGPK